MKGGGVLTPGTPPLDRPLFIIKIKGFYITSGHLNVVIIIDINKCITDFLCRTLQNLRPDAITTCSCCAKGKILCGINFIEHNTNFST